jgi:hypothetical protein
MLQIPTIRAAGTLSGLMKGPGLVVLALSAGSLMPVFATDFYVSPSGNDKKAGTASAPWKSVARVNQNHYAPGDRILFQGGAAFTGSLYFSNRSMGTAANPIVVTSFGVGRATISAGSSYGFSAYNTAGFFVSKLNFAGAGPGRDSQAGIVFYADAAGNAQFDTVHIDQVDVGGFKYGISVGGWNGLTGYMNVTITNASCHDNLEAGITVYGYTSTNMVGYPNKNVYIGHSQAFNNLGLAGDSQASGSGIVVGNSDGVVIERSLAYNNGVNNTHNGGPVGIWAWDSNNAIIQFNESHHNHTNSTTDGGGFDLDGGSINSFMQYNYSHDNDGPGFTIAEFNGARALQNNTIRYNISENDGRKNGLAGIVLWNGGSGIQNIQIFNNSVFASPASVQPRALLIESATSNVQIRNNIFVTTGAVPVIEVYAGQNGLVLQGNDYWSSGALLTFIWAGTRYNDLVSFRSATGQEIYNSAPAGMNVDPKLIAPGVGGTINNPDLLYTLNAYNLQAGSPMIDAGMWLTTFGIAPGAIDFLNTKVYRGTAYDIGAVEY